MRSIIEREPGLAAVAAAALASWMLLSLAALMTV